MVPRDTPGVVVHDDWDALGMRASGSHSVTFDDVELPAAALRGGFPTGEPVPYMERNLTAGLFHASASLGIAESAHDARDAASSVERASERQRPRRGCSPPRARSSSPPAAPCSRGPPTLIDEHHAANPTADGTDEELTALFAEAQAAKAFISEAAPRIVDRALALSGRRRLPQRVSPLARAYRDVRAGAFMHPLGANRAYEFLGQVALGREPALH